MRTRAVGSPSRGISAPEPPARALTARPLSATGVGAPSVRPVGRWARKRRLIAATPFARPRAERVKAKEVRVATPALAGPASPKHEAPLVEEGRVPTQVGRRPLKPTRKTEPATRSKPSGPAGRPTLAARERIEALRRLAKPFRRVRRLLAPPAPNRLLRGRPIAVLRPLPYPIDPYGRVRL